MSKRSKSKSRSQKKAMFEVEIVYPIKIAGLPHQKYAVAEYLVNAISAKEAKKLALWKEVNDWIDSQAEDYYDDAERRYIFEDFIEKMGGDSIFIESAFYPGDRVYNFSEISIKFSFIRSNLLKNFDINKANYMGISYRTNPDY